MSKNKDYGLATLDDKKPFVVGDRPQVYKDVKDFEKRFNAREKASPSNLKTRVARKIRGKAPSQNDADMDDFIKGRVKNFSKASSLKHKPGAPLLNTSPLREFGDKKRSNYVTR